MNFFKNHLAKIVIGAVLLIIGVSIWYFQSDYYKSSSPTATELAVADSIAKAKAKVKITTPTPPKKVVVPPAPTAVNKVFRYDTVPQYAILVDTNSIVLLHDSIKPNKADTFMLRLTEWLTGMLPQLKGDTLSVCWNTSHICVMSNENFSIFWAMSNNGGQTLLMYKKATKDYLGGPLTIAKDKNGSEKWVFNPEKPVNKVGITTNTVKGISTVAIGNKVRFEIPASDVWNAKFVD